MLGFLALVVLITSSIDHWTTYLCLREPVAGFEVIEANPLAAWLFARLGLVPGLALDGAITLAAVAFLLATPRLSHPVKVAVLLGIAAWTAAAVANNLDALAALGIPPLG
jgi:hypothetical protein